MFPGKITRDHAARSRRRSPICPACSPNIGWLTRLAIPTAGFTFGRAGRLCSNTLSRSCLARWPTIPRSKMCPPGSLRCSKGRQGSLAGWIDRIDAISNGGKKPKKPDPLRPNITCVRNRSFKWRSLIERMQGENQ